MRDQGGMGRKGSEPKSKSSAKTGRGADGEGVVRVSARAEARQVWRGRGGLITEEGVFGVQNQPSEARLSKLKYINKQAREAVPVS